MTWAEFPWVAGAAVACWAAACAAEWRGRRWGVWLALAGAAVVGVFLAGLWMGLGRPPLRTLGETRLWYAALLPVAGAAVAARWGLRWPVVYCCGMAALFAGITWSSPDSYDKTLMPALQSPWFVPHVVVYLVAYALLTGASLAGMRGGWELWRGRDGSGALEVADGTVGLGFAFLTMGLLFGALWAKTAWGHYWTWDPKETWAFLTWLGYLGYIHVRAHHPEARGVACGFLSAAWAVLLLCWFGVNYLPTAEFSVHTYAR